MTGGNGHNSHLMFTGPVKRAVSLVPSMTQSLIDLDCADTLVGVTEYCPQSNIGHKIDIIGGTHAVDIDRIVALNPDIVLANQEENDRQDVEALEHAGIRVWVSFPKDVYSAINTLWAVARIFGVMKAATPKIRLIERSLEWAERTRPAKTKSVFVPIWQDRHAEEGLYWMTFNGETYCDSVLQVCGGRNIFRDRKRRYPLQAEFHVDLDEDPGDRDIRYPRVNPVEVIAASPALILLPSEPFNFSKENRDVLLESLAETPAVENDRVINVDGRWLGWHGTMLAHALVGFPELLNQAC